jgi:hypothetical protein
MLSRFPGGIQLSQADLAFAGWLYFREEETGTREISDRDLRVQLGRAAEMLGIGNDFSTSTTALERLLRYRILRLASSGVVGRYSLTRLGRSLARSILKEADFSSDDLCTQLNTAFSGLETVLLEDDPGALSDWLRHVFQATIQEGIDYKLQGIEEELQTQERMVKEVGSGGGAEVFEANVQGVRVSRELLEELLDAVQEGSAYQPFIDRLYDCREKYLRDDHLRGLLDRCLDFLEGLKVRIEDMLAHLVTFVRACAAYQGFVGSLSMRDRLGSVQLEFLRYASEHEVRLPVIHRGRPVRINLVWNRNAGNAPVAVNRDQLAALAEYVPREIRQQGAEWRETFLAAARTQWEAGNERVLEEWLPELLKALDLDADDCLVALWSLVQDMPDWSPVVTLRIGSAWKELGPSAYIKSVTLVPHAGD